MSCLYLQNLSFLSFTHYPVPNKVNWHLNGHVVSMVTYLLQAEGLGVHHFLSLSLGPEPYQTRLTRTELVISFLRDLGGLKRPV